MPAEVVVENTVPGDKSISHRALIFSALADGDSRVVGLQDGADTRSTAAALRALGVDVAWAEGADVATVRGVGLHGFAAPRDPLDCGNSGTTARLLLGALAGCPIEAVLTGDDSLKGRPMARVTAPLTACGAHFDDLDAEGRLPIRVRGARPLSPIDVPNPRSSGQVKTAMLLAGLTGGAPVTVAEPGHSRDHSERMLRAMGAPLRTGRSEAGWVTAMEVVDWLEPLDMRVPGDFSSAAYFLALGALRGPVRIRDVGLNPTRTGALDVLRRMGARVEVEREVEPAGEPLGDVMVGPEGLRGVVVTSMEIPTLLDEVPILAVVAARAAGETRFEGVAELRVKESDRVRGVVDNLRAVGGVAEEDPHTLTVRGTDGPLRGEVDARGDHRLAMAFGVLAALPGNEIVVRGREAVGISYPGFWDDLKRINTRLEAQ